MGLTREIGVSNFTINLMQQAMATIGIEHIATNQIELSQRLIVMNVWFVPKDWLPSGITKFSCQHIVRY